MRRCLAGILAAVFLAAAPARAERLQRVVAEVNGVPITRLDLERALLLDESWQRLVFEQGRAQAERRRPIFEQAILERLIDDQVLVQVAQKRGLRLTPEEEREIAKRFEERTKKGFGSMELMQVYLEERGIPKKLPERQHRNQFLVRKVLQQDFQALDSFVRPDEVLRYYRRNVSDFETPGRVVYSLIRIHKVPGTNPEQRVEKVLRALADGEPWDDVCKAHSDGAKEDGGRVTVTALSDVKKELRDVLETLPVGGVSDPIESAPPRPGRPGSYVILRLDALEQKGRKPIDVVEAKIRETLQDARYQALLGELTRRHRERASIRRRL